MPDNGLIATKVGMSSPFLGGMYSLEFALAGGSGVGRLGRRVGPRGDGALAHQQRGEIVATDADCPIAHSEGRHLGAADVGAQGLELHAE